MNAARRMLVDEQEQATAVPDLKVVPAAPIVVEGQVAPVPPVFKGVSFGGIKNAKKEGSGRKTYPVFPDPDGTVAILAKTIVELHEQVEKFDLAKAALSEMVTPFYFDYSSGKLDVPSSVEVESPAGNVLVQFKNQYRNATDLNVLAGVLGDKAPRFFKQGFTLKVDGDKIPEQHAQALVDELQMLFMKYGAVDALSVSASLKPLPTFHAARHTELTPVQNRQIDSVCPIVKVVRPAAGRKSGRVDPTKA